MEVKPAHAPEHAVRARCHAPSDGAWMAAHHEVHVDGYAICGVTWWWVENTGNRCSMATDFKGDLKAFDLPGTNLNMLVANGAADLIAIVLRDDTPKAWLDEVIPAVLEKGDIDGMTKLRLAARWAEVKA